MKNTRSICTLSLALISLAMQMKSVAITLNDLGEHWLGYSSTAINGATIDLVNNTGATWTACRFWTSWLDPSGTPTGYGGEVGFLNGSGYAGPGTPTYIQGPGDPAWLANEIDVADLSVAQGGTCTVQLWTGLSEISGTYNVWVQPIAGPQLSVNPTGLTPECNHGENALSQTFGVWNSGGGTLSNTISESVSWLSCTPTSGTSAGELNSITVNFDTASLAPGVHHGTITVTAAGAIGSPQTVEVTLTVIPGPELALEPTALFPTCTEGQTAPSQTFDVWNSGGGSMSYTITEGISWLSCSPTNGTSTGEPDPISVTYSAAGLPSGTYSGTITIAATGASGSSQDVAVTLRVGSRVRISSEITSSNTFTITWSGGLGAWLEESLVVDGGGWSPVPNSEGASRIELPLTNPSAFYRLQVSSQALLITEQPASVAVAEGEPALLSVVATSVDAPSYQWHFRGTNLPGANSATLHLPSVQPANVGDYSAVVSNSARSITSSPAVVLITAPLGHLVRIPSNTFVMGSPDSEVDRDTDEGPQTTVTLGHGFWMGSYEVNQEEYIDVMGSNPSYFTNNLSQPVEFLGWEDATNYCSTLTQRERAAGRIPPDHEYRLPTEAEWEYACRAGTTTRFSHGDDPGYSNLTVYAWCSVNSGDTTHPVGQKPANPWGLHDMYGNVWEWCQDWYDAPYPGGTVTDPVVGPETGSLPIVRGGSYAFGGAPARSANRGAIDPPTGMRWDVGLRVVLVLTQP